MGILIDIDNVMRSPVNNAPIREGFALYHAMRGHNKITFLATNRARADHFLRNNKIMKYDDIMSTEDIVDGDDVWVRLIQKCRVGNSIEFLVTANLDLVQPMLERGLATLAFCIPSYLDHKFRPDSRGGIKTWDAITTEIARQQELLAQDGRLN